mgnify:CR=1 FL=1
MLIIGNERLIIVVKVVLQREELLVKPMLTLLP